MQSTEFVILSTTIDREDVGRELAQEIVRQRLAACVQSSPVRSTYWWNGTRETADETLLAAKTTRARSGELKRWLLARHPYKVPEIVITPIVDGSSDYLDWIARETEPPQ